MSDENRNEAVLQSLLQYDSSLKTGQLPETQILATDPVVLREIQLGRLALKRLEAAVPRQPHVMPSWAPSRIGRFEIRSVLGSGGFSVVYLAFDASLNRNVALKIPRPHVLTQPDNQRRFVNEARATAKLDHPNILAVYEAGEDGDLPYIACAWCDGPTLGRWVAAQATSMRPQVAAKIVQALANAVQYSHDHGILHRDIKPGNVLLFSQPAIADSEFPFVPRLSDFGLAKLLESEKLDSVTSQLIGTPQYMAPELIEGAHSQGTVASDVYSLGAVLYYLLVGRPPFESDSTMETLRQIVERDAVAPHVINPRIGRDLSLVCMKCLEKSPAHRFSSAGDLEQDLERYIAGRVVLARQTPWYVRLHKWHRQRPLVSSLMLATCGLSAVLLLMAVRYTVSLRELRGQLQASNSQLTARVKELATAVDSANHHKSESDANRLKAEELVFATDLNLADSLRLSGDVRGALRILKNYDPQSSSAGTIDGHDSFMWRFLMSRCTSPSVELENAGQINWDLQRSPDGRRCGTCGSGGIVRIFDVLTEPYSFIENRIAETELNNLAWCDQSPILAAGGDDGSVRICNSETLKKIREFKVNPSGAVFGLGFIPGTTSLLVTGVSGELQLWDAASGELIRSVSTPHQKPDHAIDVSPDGKLIVTGGDDNMLCLWNSEDLTLKWQREVSRGFDNESVSNVRFTQEGKSIAVVAMKQSLLMFDTQSGDRLCEWKSLDKLTAVLAGESQVICGDEVGLLSSFELTGQSSNWSPVQQWLGHDANISSIVRLQNRTANSKDIQFVSTDRSGRVVLWTGRSTPQSTDFVHDHSDTLISKRLLCWDSPQTLITCGDRQLRRRDIDGRVEQTLYSADQSIVCCQFAGDAGCTLIGLQDGNVGIIHSAEDQTSLVKVFDNQPVYDLAVDVEAHFAMARGAKHNVAVIDLQSQQVVNRLNDRTTTEMSPNGRWIVSTRASTDQYEVLDARTLKTIHVLAGFDASYANGTFTDESKYFAATSSDRTIAVWETEGWTQVNRISSTARSLGTIAMHPDGRTLAVAEQERTVTAWDILAGRKLGQLATTPEVTRSLSFSPDGASLGICYGEHGIRVIKVPLH